MLITPDVGSLPCCHRRPARHGRLPTTSQVPAEQMEGDVYLLDPQHDINVANDIGLRHGRNTKPILRSSLRAFDLNVPADSNIVILETVAMPRHRILRHLHRPHPLPSHRQGPFRG